MKHLILFLLFFLVCGILKIGAHPYDTIKGYTVVVDCNGVRMAGVIVGERMVITAYHGIAGRPNIFVNGYPAKIIYESPTADVIVLETHQKFKKEKIVDKFSKPAIQGELVFMVGHPKGRIHVVYDRTVAWVGSSIFEFSEHIKMGFSGAGVFTIKNELVGMCFLLNKDGNEQGVGVAYHIGILQTAIYYGRRYYELQK